MANSVSFLSGKRKYFLGLVLCLTAFVICAAFRIGVNDDFDIARREMILRKIGDQILLQSGDRISRVLPLKKITDNEYQISFENELTFKTDLLVSTTRRLLANAPGANDYVVNVSRCGNVGVAYGFAISGNNKDDIIACKSREQPKACYVISIKFKPAHIISKNGYLLGSLPLLALVSLIFFRSNKSKQTLPIDGYSNRLNIGSALFDAKGRKLIINGSVIELTGTEARLLLIFALSPNQTIERSRLQKEIWEDAGVIVGRSLDMFISKLRKKLEPDPNISITVIRGKGYKLEVKC